MKNNKLAKKDVYDAEYDLQSADCANCKENSAQGDKRARRRAHKMKNKIDNTSFLALLIRSFLSFSVIIIVGVLAIFIFVNWAVNDATASLNDKSVADYINELVQGKYSNVPTKAILGKHGWLDVVDTKGNVVYSSRSYTDKYGAGELGAIQKYEKDSALTLHEFKMVDDKSYCLVTRTFVDDSGAKQEQFMLLDYNREVIETTIPTNKTKYSDIEFELFVYDATHGGETLNKITFTAQDGNSYYAIFLNAKDGSEIGTYISVVCVVVAVVALLALVIFLYIKYINKHVQQPLAAMTGAMSSLASNDYHTHVDYKGSKEFEQLCDAFNEMVDLLGASEKQRDALEKDKQRMLAGLSHDLKTPITIIQGFAKAINDGLVSEEEKQKYLQIILSKSMHMSDLINQFYEYNKLEHPDFVLDKKPCDVAELARTFLAGIYDEFELRSYILETEITEEKLVCNLDEKTFVRVFENVVGNFFKYTPQGSTLLFEVGREGNCAIVRILDNGPGINDEGKKDVFEAFEVGEKSRNKQGSGLGLAVCKKIVEMHGGSICLSPEAKEGYNTEFVISLPLCDGEEDEQKEL